MEPGTIAQAAKASRLSFVAGHVALMPDAHVGKGATVGSVIPTDGHIIPAAVGVDIGCGMIASETSLKASALPDSLESLLTKIELRIPAGVGKGFTAGDLDSRALKAYGATGRPATQLDAKREVTAQVQFGTLGSGNHFVEVCTDERDVVWTVLHSGSRGIGNQLATEHIAAARGAMKEAHITLEDPDLAYLVQGTPEFSRYLDDMLWAQRYAMASRLQMAHALNRSLFEAVGRSARITTGGAITRQINCHHNFTQLEHHGGRDIWVTRKGAIKAGLDDWGVIPGSMGTGSFIVQGMGNPDSFSSCSHGAGRRLSRGQARRTLTAESLTEVMGGRAWNGDRAASLVDEHPKAYKDIGRVMAAQSDLCRIEHRLTQVLNYKG
jgi:tRNA-splicing ligase RtcB